MYFFLKAKCLSAFMHACIGTFFVVKCLCAFKHACTFLVVKYLSVFKHACTFSGGEVFKYTFLLVKCLKLYTL